MGAEDVRHLQGSGSHDWGLHRLQGFQWADHLTQDGGGHLGVMRGGLDLLVSQ
jgi:hypothetical protein